MEKQLHNISWKNTFNAEYKIYEWIDKAFKAAREAEYPYIAWNGWVFKTNSKGREIDRLIPVTDLTETISNTRHLGIIYPNDSKLYQSVVNTKHENFARSYLCSSEITKADIVVDLDNHTYIKNRFEDSADPVPTTMVSMFKCYGESITIK